MPGEAERQRSLLPGLATPYLLVLPVAIYLALFVLYPMVQAVRLGVTDAQGAWTLEHVRRMASDLYFWMAVRNTLLITALAVPLQLVLALSIALLVNTRFLGHAAFLYVCAIPLAVSDLAAGLIWLSVFTERGYLNAEVWRATAIVMVVLVAGLQLLPRDYAETAAVFGANRWQTLWHVLLPLLRPSLQTALIIRTVLAFQLFATVVTLSGRLVPVLAGETYFWYTLYRNPHVASAYATLVLLLSALVTWIYLRTLQPEGEGT